ncbi:hypothetical protein FOZ62_001760 [Perkinsus olseni]|uniref:Uncharacterized protein n=1 Tax=Perkinsus olseni TaxID=32597 RepID=A0A7J6QDR8_PEROL|nr:hypothetical protein FOZ62_001760 [Perkinsus olseni]
MLACVLYFLHAVVAEGYSSPRMKEMFEAYKERFEHDFGDDDDYRMAVFEDNLRYIEEENAKGLSYTLKITPFAHLTNAEFKDTMFGRFPESQAPLGMIGSALSTPSTAHLRALQGLGVGLDGWSEAFQHYGQGVLDSGCYPATNHAVLTVGYDLGATKPYYLVKNSWGTSWGEEGYMKIAIDDSPEGVCGILLAPSFPVKA